MFRTQQLRWVAAAFVVVLATAPAKAQNPSTGLGDDFARVVGKGVITCVRPSSLPSSKVEGHRYSFPGSGRMDLTIETSWRGIITDTLYRARFTVKLSVASGIEVLGVDYTDDCLFPAPDLRPLNALIRELNRNLR